MTNPTDPPKGQYLLILGHWIGVGLWLGALIFFPTCVALPVIRSMQEFATRPDNWLQLHSPKEGIRLAGEFLDVVFRRYFLFQLACGVLATIPALLWLRRAGRVNHVRVGLMVLALSLVAVNQWWLSPQVHHWRFARYSVSNPLPGDTGAAVVQSAETQFQFWHTLSLTADLITLALVLAVATLAPLVLVPREHTPDGTPPRRP
ncbi:MAG: DUF4149 domain-containing protein [Gemmatales bacterium]|nr:DUF4149 domain-containing protein [Gemmatales bacterium]MDW8222850.1 DUF4149 domain-containing protein [Gemmatales bacterium]